MEFRILGPLEVVDRGRAVPLGGARQRALLAVLLLHANEAVSTERLIDDVWGEAPSPTAAKAIQVYVSLLRKELGDGNLVTRAPGYVLQVDRSELDLSRFEQLVTDARAADPEIAATKLREALALWRGPPLADFAQEPFARADIARLEELRLTAIEERLDADLAIGRQDLVGELKALVAEHPLRERLRGQLMLALYRAGRQAESLDAYRDARHALSEELGLEPSEELKRLEKAVLQHDPALDVASTTAKASSIPAVGLSARRSLLPLAVVHHARAFIVTGLALLVVGIAAAVVLSTRGSTAPSKIGPTSLAVIDPNGNRLAAEIPLGFKSNMLAAGEGFVWVADAKSSTLVKIDPKTRAVVDRIGIEAEAVPIALAVGNGAVWVAVLRGSRQVVLQFGAAHGELRHTYVAERDFAGDVASQAALAIGRGTVWLLAPSTGRLWRIDSTSGRVALVTEGVGDAFSLAIGPGALWLGTLTGVRRIDPRNGRTVATTTVGASKFGAGEAKPIAFGGGMLWFARSSSDVLWRIDPHTNLVTLAIAVGDGPSAIAVGDGAVWVANSRGGSITRVDPARGETTTLALGSRPGAVAAAYDVVWVSPGAPRG